MIKFIFDGKYFEYGREEIYPDVYVQKIDENLKDLLEKRIFYIKMLNSCASNIKKYEEKEEDITGHKQSAYNYLKEIYDVEETIDGILNSNGLTYEWYHKTNPIPEDEVEVLEDQSREICFNCGEIFVDYNPTDYGLSYEDMENGICPKCNQEDVLYCRNIHLYNAEKIQEKIDVASNEEDYERAKELVISKINELKLVNNLNENWYEQARYELGGEYQILARIYVTLEDYENVDINIRKAISIWDKLVDENKMLDYNVVAFGYFVKHNSSLTLERNIDEILQDYKKVFKYLEIFKKRRENFYSENHNKENYDRDLREYESVMLMEYVVVVSAYEMKGNIREFKNILIEAKHFLEKTNHLRKEEFVDYQNMINSGLDQYTEYENSSQITQQETTHKEGCYIATAVYGNYDAKEVKILRKFRDEYLSKRSWGRLFIKTYYKVSPSIANKMKNMKGINNSVKLILDKIVAYINERM